MRVSAKIVELHKDRGKNNNDVSVKESGTASSL